VTAASPLEALAALVAPAGLTVAPLAEPGLARLRCACGWSHVVVVAKALRLDPRREVLACTSPTHGGRG
jgi:hypothetical protein